MLAPDSTVVLHELADAAIPDQGARTFDAHVVGDHEFSTALLDNVAISQTNDGAERDVQVGSVGNDVAHFGIRQHFNGRHQSVVHLNTQHVSLEVQVGFQLVNVDQTDRVGQVNRSSQVFQGAGAAEVQVAVDGVACLVDRRVAQVVLLQVDLRLDVVGNTGEVSDFGSGSSRHNDLAAGVRHNSAAHGQVSSNYGRCSTSYGILLRTQTRGQLLQRNSVQRFGRVTSQSQVTGHDAAGFRQVVVERAASGNCQGAGTVVPFQCFLGRVDPDKAFTQVASLRISSKTLRLQATNFAKQRDITILEHVCYSVAISTILIRGFSSRSVSSFANGWSPTTTPLRSAMFSSV